MIVKPRSKALKTKKLAGPSEAEITKAIGDYLDQRGILNWRNNTQAALYTRDGKTCFRKSKTKGFPDRSLMYRGIPVCLEVKTAKGKLTFEQIRWLTDLQEHGVVARVVRSLDEATAVLAEIDELVEVQACPP